MGQSEIYPDGTEKMQGWSQELSLPGERSVWPRACKVGCLEEVGWESSHGRYTEFGEVKRIRLCLQACCE